MRDLYPTSRPGYSWLAPPTVNACTRLAVAANAAAGGLEVQGWEATAPPPPFCVSERPAATGSAPAGLTTASADH